MMAEPFSIVRARSEAPRARASVRIDLMKMIHLGQAAVPVLQPHLKMLELERPLEERTMEAQKNRDSVPCSASPAGVCESMF